MNVDPEEPVLQVKGLRFGWSGPRLFDGLSFDITPGVTLVQGDDGSGKSTLLRLMAGAQNADDGSLVVHGIHLDEHHDAYRHEVFWIDPQTEAHDALAARGYLDSLSHHYPRFDTGTMAEMIEGFALGPHLAKPMYMLSTGSRRKVGLVGAAASGARLTLVDAPFAALDAPSIRALTALFEQAAADAQRTWVVADHELPAALAGVPLAGWVDLGD